MKAIITLGASASGKSTWTREFIQNESALGRQWVELNKDDTRIEMVMETGALRANIPSALKAWDYSPNGAAELAVKERLSSKLAQAVAGGAYGVVFSNTNIDGGVGALAQISKHCPDASVEFKLFPVDFDTCVQRDAVRTLSVGVDVLLFQFGKLAELDMGFPSAPQPFSPAPIAPNP